MKVSYGFVFYFEIFIIILTALQILLYIKPLRNLLFNLISKYKFGEGIIFLTIWWMIFIVISIILIDSVLSYWTIRSALTYGTFPNYSDINHHLQTNTDEIAITQHDDYIILYKKLREYYMA
jgi:hypothetical protein